jgi:hypothetical protein
MKLRNLINKLFGRKEPMATKSANYTEEQVVQIVDAYVANPSRETVESLASNFGKTTRSIIAKLSREGVYIAAPRTTKAGTPVVAKQSYVDAIENHFESELPSLIKVSKADLAKMVELMGLEISAQ